VFLPGGAKAQRRSVVHPGGRRPVDIDARRIPEDLGHAHIFDHVLFEQDQWFLRVVIGRPGFRVAIEIGGDDAPRLVTGQRQKPPRESSDSAGRRIDEGEPPAAAPG